MKQPKPELIIRRLIDRMSLHRIEIVTNDGKSFTAIAHPASYNPIIMQRLKTAFADKAEWTLAEATQRRERVYAEPICRETRATILESLVALTASMTAVMTAAHAKLVSEL